MTTPTPGLGPGSREVLDAVRGRLPVADGAAFAEVVAAVARERGLVLGEQGLVRLVRRAHDELLGAGPLQALLDEPEVTDVLVNAPDEVWVERAGRLERVPASLGGAADVRALAVRLAAAAGQRLDDAAPAVDGHLPDGTRLHAVLPPVSGQCAVLSLRTTPRRAFSLRDLSVAGALAPGLERLLVGLVEVRASLLVSGATGAGKTTLLAALVGAVAVDQRVVVIEEARELAPRHPHVVRLVARRPNVDGAGRVDLTDLVRHAMRMRPDRIVLGECRGPEVVDVLAALNTGHDGGFATVHANAATDVPARLEALGALAGLSRAALAAQAASAIDVVLHMRRERGRRFLAEVGIVARRDDGRLVVTTALTCSADGEVVAGPGIGALDRMVGGVS